MKGKKRYIALILFLLLGLTIFTFANPAEEELDEGSGSDVGRVQKITTTTTTTTPAIEKVEENDNNNNNAANANNVNTNNAARRVVGNNNANNANAAGNTETVITESGVNGNGNDVQNNDITSNENAEKKAKEEKALEELNKKIEEAKEKESNDDLDGALKDLEDAEKLLDDIADDKKEEKKQEIDALKEEINNKKDAEDKALKALQEKIDNTKTSLEDGNQTAADAESALEGAEELIPQINKSLQDEKSKEVKDLRDQIEAKRKAEAEERLMDEINAKLDEVRNYIDDDKLDEASAALEEAKALKEGLTDENNISEIDKKIADLEKEIAEKKAKKEAEEKALEELNKKIEDAKEKESNDDFDGALKDLEEAEKLLDDIANDKKEEKKQEIDALKDKIAAEKAKKEAEEKALEELNKKINDAKEALINGDIDGAEKALDGAEELIPQINESLQDEKAKEVKDLRDQIEKAREDAAEKAVEDAKENPTDENITDAQEKIDDVKDEEKKNELQEELDKIKEEKEIKDNAEKLLKELEEKVNNASSKAGIDDARRFDEENKVLAAINMVADETTKNSLIDRYNVIKEILDDTTSPVVTGINNNDVAKEDVMFSVSDETDVVVKLNDKVITDYKVTEDGTYRLVVTDKAFNETVIEFIIDKTIYANGISLNKTNFKLNKNSTYDLVATVTPENATDKTVTWKSSNTKIVQVDNNGKVKGISKGTANVTATNSNGDTASATITVIEEPTLKSVQYRFFKNDYSSEKGIYFKINFNNIKYSNADSYEVKLTDSNGNVLDNLSSENGKFSYKFWVKFNSIDEVTLTITLKSDGGTKSFEKKLYPAVSKDKGSADKTSVGIETTRPKATYDLFGKEIISAVQAGVTGTKVDFPYTIKF